MTYKDGSWGEKAKARSRRRKEYFRNRKAEGRPVFKPKGSIKVNARQRVRDHMLAGKITRPENCESCDDPCTPEAHHDDYTKPLQVVFLCKSCHVTADCL